jgi:serine O-acetyltransferase
MDYFLDFFNGFLGRDIPKAFVIYLESRKAFLSHDFDLAERLYRLNYILHNSSVPYTAEIGKNTIFAYGGIGVVLHAGSVIGERCNIGSNVTVGGDRTGVPKIGHDVYLATGSKIIGNVEIGDGAVIGANAVVKKNVSPFEIVGGIPAKPIAKIDKINFEKYSGYYWCKGDHESIKRFVDWYSARGYL